MAEVPDPFGRGRPQRVVRDANEDEIGKALPASVIRQLDANLGLLGPEGRSGSMAAADLQAMQQVIYGLLRDTGRRPGEIVSLKVGCVEVIDGQPNLVYDNHKAGRSAAGCRSRARPPRTFSPGSAPGRNWVGHGHPTLVVPTPLAQGPASHSATSPELRRPGVRDLGGEDRDH